MPTTTSSQGDSLLKDLACETITTEYNQLKAQNDRLMKKEQQSKLDLEQALSRLDEARMAATMNQREKELVENKLLGVTSAKHESEALVSDLRQSMALLRSENTKLSQDSKEYYIRVIKIQSEKDAEHYENETLKLQVNDLHQRLNNSTNNEESARQAQMRAESEARLQFESQRRDYEQAQAQKRYLENEMQSLSTHLFDLRQQVTRYKTEMECAVEKCDASEDRIKKLEANRAATKANHESLIDIYEKQRLESEEMIANFSSDLQLIQQKAATEHSKLLQENDSLRHQLAEATDRLQVSRNSVEKLLEDKENVSPSTSSQPTKPSICSNLLKMMKQYEQTGKHWDEIYTDFFDLREDNMRLTAIKADLISANDQLVRDLTDNQQYKDQLVLELERLREKSSESYATTLESLTALKSSSTKEISELKHKADELQQKNNDLEATVNDTTYQLRYLLRYVECQYERLPPTVQNTNDLLANAHIPPSLSHEEMIFKDASDCVQRNQELMTQLRHLSSQLHEKTTEALAAKDSISQLNDKLAESASLIRDHNEMIQVLELRLSRATQAPLQQPSNSSINLDSDAPMLNASSPDENPKSQDSQDLAAAVETCHVQRQEIAKLTFEIQGLRRDHTTLQSEMDQLKGHTISLANLSSARAGEIDDLRSLLGVRESHIGDLEGRLLVLNSELKIAHRNLESMRIDHTSVSAQLKASTDSYQHLLLENKAQGTERMNLATLLQNMNDSLGSSTSGTVHLVEELKQHNERLSRELQNLRDTLASKEKEIQNYQAIDPSEWKDKYQVTSGELKQLRTTYLEIEKQLATVNQDRIIAQTKLMEALQNTSSVATTGSDSLDQPSLSGQAEQLIDANNQVAALKKDIFTFKERLMDSDACINKITEEYNTFARDAQLQIDKLSDDLATSHKTVDSLQVQLEKTVAEHKVTMTTYRSFEQQWDTARTTLVEENDQLKAKVTNVTKQIADLQAELNTTVEQLEQGEERYHAEVAARALDATVIAGLRDDIQHLNMDISASRSEVVGANERLRSAEVSYQKQKEHLESIQNDTKLRLDESQKQQESLSALIQNLLTQVNDLRTSPNDIDNAALSTLGENATQQLRDLNASLRREKDIWQTRYTDAQQRADCLASDLEFVQQQLSTTRALLKTMRDEREQTTKGSHQGLKDANNEAALYKKHNASLRSTMDELRGRVVELESLVAAKEELVEPLTLKAKGLELELAQTKEHIQTLEVRQAQWSARSARLLAKYDISDPQDIDQLKGEMEVAKTQLDAKTKSLEAAEKQHQDLVTRTTQIEEQLKRVTESANQRGKLAFEFKKKAADLEESKMKLEEQLAERQKGKQQQEAPDPKIKELEEACQKQTEEHTALRNKYTTLLRTAKQLSTDKRALEPLKQEKTELTKQLDDIKAEMDQLKAQLTTKTTETSSLTVEIGRLKAMHSMITNKNDKLKKELATLQAGPSGINNNKSTLTASAPAFIPAGKETPPGNHLKRAATDDLDSQPPAKK